MAIHRQLMLCRRMRSLREGSGMTQTQVAEALGISQAAYSRLEKGEIEVPVSKLFTLGELYGVAVQDLLRGI